MTYWRWNWLLTIIIGVSIIIWILLATWAFGAAPELCRPYAAAFTNKIIPYIWNRAFSTCLNSDELPAQPENWSKAVDIVNGEPIDVSKIGVSPATAKPQLVVDQDLAKPSAKVCGRNRASGFEPGSLQQRVWCKRQYRSYRAKDGTVLCKTGKRVPCA